MSHPSMVSDIVIGVVACLLIAAGVRRATRKSRFPFSVALVLTGMGLTWVADDNHHLSTAIGTLHVSPELVLYVFLPTLVFEAAFNLDVRLLRTDLPSILLLAAPGLLLSTAVIGVLLTLTLSIPLSEALLLGAILSATDPVAVIALFKQLGVARRLSTLVEGESLFNDATAIVLSRILVAVIAAGNFTLSDAVGGVIDFTIIFIGGVLTGWILALGTRKALGAIESDSAVEITLTTTLAYLSFLVAEELFGVSGVMATVAAGLTLGGKGRAHISPSVRGYLENFWEYLAFVANALIFLMVGLQVRLGALVESLDQLAWVFLAMLLSRALVVYGLTPLAASWPGAEPVDRRYQAVMCWGGLRGAIALAIAMSLPGFERYDLFVTLVTGAVLATLLLQGLSIDWLVRRLGLDRPPLADRFARIEAQLMAAQRAHESIPHLNASGLYSRTVARKLEEETAGEIGALHASLDELRRGEMDREQERSLLLLFGFTEEKALSIDLFGKGHISEGAFNELTLTLDLQMDAIRHHRDVASVDYHHLSRDRWSKRIMARLDRLAILAPVTRRFHQARIAHDYEVSWGRLQGSVMVLARLGAYTRLRSFNEDVVEEVRQRYMNWRDTTSSRLDEYASQMPGFVTAMHSRLGNRLMLLAKIDMIDEQARRGSLPRGVAEEIDDDLRQRLRRLRGIEVEALELSPSELVGKVPFFRELGAGEFAALASKMTPRAYAEREEIIRQGETGSSMYFIVRGVVRVSRAEGGTATPLATLMSGDFFGEKALLHHTPRMASVWAATPCSLYELKREELAPLMDAHPRIKAAIEKADQERRG